MLHTCKITSVIPTYTTLSGIKHIIPVHNSNITVKTRQTTLHNGDLCPNVRQRRDNVHCPLGWFVIPCSSYLDLGSL